MEPEGELSRTNALDVLLELYQREFTGAIRVERDAIIKIIYLRQGDLLSASTNDREDSIGDILLRADKLTREHLKQALIKRKENESLGETLLSLGFVTRNELAWARRTQLVGVIRSVLGWTEGSFNVVENYLPRRDEGVSFNFPQVILEVFVTDPDRASMQDRLQGGAVILQKAPGFEEALQRLQLNEDADEVASFIDGRRTASAIAEASSVENVSVLQLLAAFLALDLVRVVGGTKLTAEAEVQQPDLTPESVAPVTVSDAAVDAEPEAGVRPDALTVELQRSREALEEDPRRAPPTQAAKRSSRLIPFLVIVFVLLVGAAWLFVWKFSGSETLQLAGGPNQRSTAAVPERNPEVVREGEGTLEPSPMLGGSPATNGAPSSDSALSERGVIILSADDGASTAVSPPTTAGVPNVRRSPESLLPPPPRPSPSRAEATAAAVEGAPTPEAAPTADRPVPVFDSTDPERARYQAMAERWARSVPSYTLQFAILCQTTSVAQALRTDPDQVWLVPMSFRGQPCFRAFWGRFETREAAQSAIDRVPARLTDSGRPVVVKP